MANLFASPHVYMQYSEIRMRLSISIASTPSHLSETKRPTSVIIRFSAPAIYSRRKRMQIAHERFLVLFTTSPLNYVEICLNLQRIFSEPRVEERSRSCALLFWP